MRLIPAVSQQAIDEAIRQTIKASPHEICGFFVPDPDGLWHFHLCKNLASDTKNFFTISYDDYAPYQNNLNLIIVHSHPTGPAFPSYQDMQLACDAKLIGAIIAPDRDNDYGCIFYGGFHPPPFTNRIYRHGVTDCYGLVRDYYAAYFDIALDDVPREWDWWHKHKDYYRDHFKAFDFHILEDAADLQKGDLCLMRLRSSVDNHCGIYDGNGLILHHLAGREAVDHTRFVRHEPIMRLMPFITLFLRHNSQI